MQKMATSSMILICGMLTKVRFCVPDLLATGILQPLSDPLERTGFVLGDWETHGGHRPFSLFAFYMNVSHHDVHDVPHKREAEAQPVINTGTLYK